MIAELQKIALGNVTRALRYGHACATEILSERGFAEAPFWPGHQSACASGLQISLMAEVYWDLEWSC